MRRLIIVLTLLVAMAVFANVALAWDTTHVVAPGETLFRIATRYGVSVSALASANGIWNPNRIYAGQVLVIPSAYTPPPYTPPPYTPPPYNPGGGNSYYTVRYGDSLANIAARFHTTVYAIASANSIYNVNYVYAGQVLYIPYVPVVYDYWVRRGDTLSTIAVRYGTTVWAISNANGIWNPNLIYTGMYLRVPV
jgi:peptidoglycan-N-acetylglucosamine deacetylase